MIKKFEQTQASEELEEPETEEYEVEEVLKKRHRKGKVEYYVKWKNYLEWTWEPVSNLANAKSMIEEFEKEKDKEVPQNKEYEVENAIKKTHRKGSDVQASGEKKKINPKKASKKQVSFSVFYI